MRLTLIVTLTDIRKTQAWRERGLRGFWQTLHEGLKQRYLSPAFDKRITLLLIIQYHSVSKSLETHSLASKNGVLDFVKEFVV